MLKSEINGVSVSMLGFGCMRLPVKKAENGKTAIDEEQAGQLLDMAYQNGVNYFDTAYPYIEGLSEPFVGKALSKYDRSSYFIATKLPCWGIKSLEDAKRIFNKQLERLDKEYIDFYLLHSLNKELWDKVVELGVVDFCEKLKEQGKIKNLGFSFHDEYEVFEDIIKSRKWDFCQLQLNYMDTEEQAGIKGHDLAMSLNVPVIVMEPVKGGLLASLPDDIERVFREYDGNASVASWALKWAGSLPGVKAVLSGMSDAMQVTDNLNTFKEFKPLNKEQLNIVNKAAGMMKSRVNNSCTGCRYCMPCPSGVDIPYNFSIWNGFGIYGDRGRVEWQWNHEIGESKKAKNCKDCGLCEKACPQKIEIRKDLSRLQKQLDSLTR